MTSVATVVAPAIDITTLPCAAEIPVQAAVTPEFRRIRIGLGLALRSLFRISVSGRENIPTGPYILIANHLNWVDAPALLATFPELPRLHVLGEIKHIVKKPKLWDLVLRSGGIIPVANGRHDDTLRSHIDSALRRGVAVVIFPEGTYEEREGDVLPFKKGFAHFAVNNSVPVLPVAISGTKRLWLRKRLRIIIGTPIQPAAMTADEMAEAGRSAIIALQPAQLPAHGPHIFERKLTHLLFSGHNDGH